MEDRRSDEVMIRYTCGHVHPAVRGEGRTLLLGCPSNGCPGEVLGFVPDAAPAPVVHRAAITIDYEGISGRHHARVPQAAYAQAVSANVSDGADGYRGEGSAPSEALVQAATAYRAGCGFWPTLRSLELAIERYRRQAVEGVFGSLPPEGEEQLDSGEGALIHEATAADTRDALQELAEHCHATIKKSLGIESGEIPPLANETAFFWREVAFSIPPGAGAAASLRDYVLREPPAQALAADARRHRELYGVISGGLETRGHGGDDGPGIEATSGPVRARLVVQRRLKPPAGMELRCAIDWAYDCTPSTPDQAAALAGLIADRMAEKIANAGRRAAAERRG